jgi:hypothetical protein
MSNTVFCLYKAKFGRSYFQLFSLSTRLAQSQLFANCATAERASGALGSTAIECGSQTTITSKGVMRWWRVLEDIKKNRPNNTIPS